MFEPIRRPSAVRVATVDIGRPSPEMLEDISNETAYAQVWIITLRGDRPLGIVAITPSQIADGAELWRLLLSHFPEVSAGIANNSRLEDPPLVSIVIPTHGRRTALLTACLDSISRLTYTNFEVLVVENGPEARRADSVHWERFPMVRRIGESRANASRARNAGIEAALGEIVAFTDDDIQVHPHWLTAVVERFRTLPEVDAVTGTVLPWELETPAQIWFERYYGGFNRSFVRSYYDSKYASKNDPCYPYAVGRFGTGGNMAWRIEVIRRLGGFNERLGPGTPSLGGEDGALLLKLILAGYRLGVEPSAMVYHTHLRTDAELMREVRSYGVGVAALLTATVMSDPRRLVQLIRSAPAGLRLVLQPREAVPSIGGEISTVPMRLRFEQARGLLSGPPRYFYSLARSGN